MMGELNARPTSLAWVRYAQETGLMDQQRVGVVDLPPVDVYATRNWRWRYIRSHLDVGECCRRAQPLHWAGLVHSLLGLEHLTLLRHRAVAVVVGSVVGTALLGWWPAQLLLGLGAVAHSGRMVWSGLQWRAASIIVTDRRLIYPRGVIGRSAASTPLHMITNHEWSQSWVGRVLGYGTLRVESGGLHDDGATRELIRWVRDVQVVDRMLGVPIGSRSW